MPLIDSYVLCPCVIQYAVIIVLLILLQIAAAVVAGVYRYKVVLQLCKTRLAFVSAEVLIAVVFL